MRACLTSDVTPGRSGYILTPVYLRDQDVPTSKGLSSVLGIQTFEFLIKVIGGIGAVIFLVSVAPPATWDAVFHHVSIFGVNVGFLAAVLGISLDDGWRNRACSFHMVQTSHLNI